MIYFLSHFSAQCAIHFCLKSDIVVEQDMQKTFSWENSSEFKQKTHNPILQNHHEENSIPKREKFAWHCFLISQSKET